MADERDYIAWQEVADRIFIHLIKKGETFNADTFYQLARAEYMPAQLLRKISGNLFKSYQQAGYIRKSGTYAVSSRNDGNLIAEWITTAAEAKAGKKVNV